MSNPDHLRRCRVCGFSHIDHLRGAALGSGCCAEFVEWTHWLDRDSRTGETPMPEPLTIYECPTCAYVATIGGMCSGSFNAGRHEQVYMREMRVFREEDVQAAVTAALSANEEKN